MSESSPRAFIYLRISQDRSGAGLGVQRQRADCERKATELGLKVVEIFEDNDTSAYSGRKRRRYQEMISRLDEVGHVIVWHLDRLYRRPSELEAYITLTEDRSLPTHSVMGGTLDLSTGNGRFEARIHTAVAARESEHKAERSSSRAKQTVAQGRHVGGPRPFGWNLIPRTELERFQKLGSRYELNEREANAIRGAADALLSGRSIGSLLREWSDPQRADGPLLTTQGNAWSHAAFRNMMLRPRNGGVVTSGGNEVGRDLYEAPLTFATWRAVVRMLDSRKAPKGHSNKARRLSVGIALCPCGRPVKTSGVSGQTVDPETGKRPYHWTYFCKSPGTGHVSKRVGPVDDVVKLAVSDLFWQPPAFNRPLSVKDEARREELIKELRELDHRYQALAEQFAKGDVSPKMMGLTEREIDTLRTAVDDELTALEEKSRSLRPGGDPFGVERYTALMEDWLTWHLDDQRDFVRSRLKVELLPTPKNAPRVFDPHSVRVTVLGTAGVEDDGTDDQLIYPGARIGPYWRYYEGPEMLKERVGEFQRHLRTLRRLQPLSQTGG